MSRGLGKMQRHIMDTVDYYQWTPIWDIAMLLNKDSEDDCIWASFRDIPKSKLQSVYRAIRTLKKRGLVEVMSYQEISQKDLEICNGKSHSAKVVIRVSCGPVDWALATQAKEHP